MFCGGSLVASSCRRELAQLLQLLEIGSAEQGRELAMETLPEAWWLLVRKMMINMMGATLWLLTQ